MIFSARSRLPWWTASQASSASLRARRRSFTFCFLGFIRSSSVRSRVPSPFPGYGNTLRHDLARMVRDRASHASAVGLGWHPFEVGNALTEEDLDVHSHNQNCKRQGELHKMTRAVVARSPEKPVRQRKSKGLAAEARKPFGKLPETGLEPALPVKATRPSTW